MIPNTLRKLILRSAVGQLAYWRAQSFPFGVSRAERGRIQVARADAKAGIVAYEPQKWLGRALSDAERKRFSRELVAMQADGLIQRIGQNRTSHIRIIGLEVEK